MSDRKGSFFGGMGGSKGRKDSRTRAFSKVRVCLLPALVAAPLIMHMLPMVQDQSAMRKSVFQQPVLFEGWVRKARSSLFWTANHYFDRYLQKLASGKIKRWQSRYFQLSGHYLKYYEVQVLNCKSSIQTNGLSLVCVDRIRRIRATKISKAWWICVMLLTVSHNRKNSHCKCQMAQLSR